MPCSNRAEGVGAAGGVSLAGLAGRWREETGDAEQCLLALQCVHSEAVPINLALDMLYMCGALKLCCVHAVARQDSYNRVKLR